MRRPCVHLRFAPPFSHAVERRAATAALTVAIPATFGYNILANRLNRLDNLLEGFGTTLIAMLGREGRL